VPTWLVDGARVRAGVADSTVRAIPLSRIGGIEVYRAAAEVPAVFSDLAARCGVIGIWKRSE
jgi:hypothetical protein